jgi:hypothetical protein
MFLSIAHCSEPSSPVYVISRFFFFFHGKSGWNDILLFSRHFNALLKSSSTQFLGDLLKGKFGTFSFEFSLLFFWGKSFGLIRMRFSNEKGEKEKPRSPLGVFF